MTSQPTNKQRPTVLEAVKQMGLLGWGLVIILSAGITSSAVKGDAPWWLVPFVIFGFTLLMIAVIRYPEARPLSMDQRQSNLLLKRNQQLSAAFHTLITDVNNIAMNADEATGKELLSVMQKAMHSLPIEE